MQGNEELLPCPFCGSAGQIVELRSILTGVTHYTPNCSRRSGECILSPEVACAMFSTRDEAVAAWNRRVGHGRD